MCKSIYKEALVVKKPKALMLEEALYRRLAGYNFSDDYYYVNSGYEGEVLFLQKFPIKDCHLQLFNITLQVDNTKFEIDRAIITGDGIYAFDVKNYGKGYEIINNDWYKNKNIIKNPMTQYNGMKNGLNTIAKLMTLPHDIYCYTVFIKKEFNINQKLEGILLYNEIHQTFRKIHNDKPVSQLDKKLLTHIESNHIPLTFHNRRPQFDIRNIEFGLKCMNCNSSILKFENNARSIVCSSCLSKTTKIELILNNLIDLDIIIARPFSTKEAHKWIGTDYRNITLRVLNQYFISTENDEYYYKYNC